MSEKNDSRIPKSVDLIEPTFLALKSLGGSGRNDEILDKVISDLHIPNDVADILHKGSENRTELSYRIAWAKTYLKLTGVIESSARGVWSINPEYMTLETIDGFQITKLAAKKEKLPPSGSGAVPVISPVIPIIEPSIIDEEPWRKEIAEKLYTMNPYGFERLAQRLLRECDFTHVTVTKKSGDGGIDGTAKLKFNNLISFNVAFQCKRYRGSVGAPEIRDFRGSLPSNVEKGLFITTGTFTRAAIEEAASPGKQQIDLMDGSELIDMMIKRKVGVEEVKSYKVDEEFFEKIETQGNSR